MNGTDVLILADIGSGVFEPVGSQTDASVDETNALIDRSNKVSGRSRRVDYGRYEATYSFDALFVPNDAAFQALKSAARLGAKIKLREQQFGNAVEEVEAVITSMTREYPDQDNATISLEAAVDGPITVI